MSNFVDNIIKEAASYKFDEKLPERYSFLKESYHTDYNADIFYSTWEEPYRFDEFIETEVRERKNYSKSDIKQWAKKYNLHPWSQCVWVTPDKYRAMSYHDDIDDHDEWMENAEKENRTVDVYEYYKKDGFVIPESDDGDNGVLFVFNEK